MYVSYRCVYNVIFSQVKWKTNISFSIHVSKYNEKNIAIKQQYAFLYIDSHTGFYS